METVLGLLATPAGQALMSAGVSQVLSLLGGADPASAAADFNSAVSAYQQATAGWEKAKTEHPPAG